MNNNNSPVFGKYRLVGKYHKFGYVSEIVIKNMYNKKMYTRI